MSAQIVRSSAPATSQSAAPVSALRVERLVKSFDARPVLRGVTFTAHAGLTLTILGPNGAGKTTLLRTLATLARPTSGEVWVAGFAVSDEAQEVRRRVGYVGHQPHAYDDLTARENLLFFARMYGLRDGAERAEKLLERVGLRRRADDRVRAFSRGQAQRLALARGLIHDPTVLLLDEPDTGLDQEALATLEAIIAERRERGLTTALTTHNLERGLRVADDALALVRGRVAYKGAASALDVAAVERLYAGEVWSAQATGGAA